VHRNGLMRRNKQYLFDDFVSSAKNGKWHTDPESLGSS